MSKPKEEDGCGTCRCWREGTEAGDEVRWGVCHRYPPTVITSDSDDGANAVQPWTVLPHWCYEHKQRLQ